MVCRVSGLGFIGVFGLGTGNCKVPDAACKQQHWTVLTPPRLPPQHDLGIKPAALGRHRNDSRQQQHRVSLMCTKHWWFDSNSDEGSCEHGDMM